MASRGTDSDAGSMTPSERSDDERSEHDSDYETDEEEEEENSNSENLNIVWTGYGKKNPVIIFKADAILNKTKNNLKCVGERYHMAYKFTNTECKIIRTILQSHGFNETHPNSSDYNVVWSNGHLKPFTLRSMTEFQKINHFPRSYELTRKDRLFKNIQRMQQVKGFKHFDFIPQSFVLPGEYQDFCSMYLKDKGPYIVKPVASSRGRGVFLINHPDQVPLDENVIVCKYLSNPLLIDGFKFDVRLYIAVTSYDPLVIYLFEEGLTRFATVKYEKTNKQIRNQCMHLTNYSVNKKSDDYVRNDDPDVEDYGNKWSLGALLRYLRSEGKDTAALMMRIEDVIMKTIISVELPVATACKMFMPHRGNCFELYGFDVLIDDNLKPWIIEVNLSPSLACDSPMDLKIKSNMLCDLFSLTGLVCHDPMVKNLQQSRRNLEIASKLARSKSARVRPSSASSQKRPLSAGSSANQKKDSKNPVLAGLNSDEIKIIRRVKEEDARRSGWVRIFPSADSWDTHSQFLQFNTTHNLTLHQRLYPDRHKGTSVSKSSSSQTSTGQRARNTYLQLSGSNPRLNPERSVEAYAQALLRTRQYERRLGPRKKRRGKKRGERNKDNPRRLKLAQGIAEDLLEEGEEVSDSELAQENEPVPKETDVEKIDTKIFNPSNNVKSDVVSEKTVETKPAPVTIVKPEVVKKITFTNVPPPATAVAMFEEKPSTIVEETNKPPTPPPTPPPEPKFNVVELLNKGGTLSKVQARSAFAMYLVRVEDRLLSDNLVLSPDAVEALNEQMDLVLRFLKRAAVNLQQSFKIVVPSRKLPLIDRRRILAKQLGDFVHIYNKETEQLKGRNQIEKSHSKRADNSEGLHKKKFNHFVLTASESELEDVLTTYTRINKSASIFLGSNSKSEASQSCSNPSTNSTQSSVKSTSSVKPAPNVNQSEPLAKRKGSVEGEWEEVPRIRSSSNNDLRYAGNYGNYYNNSKMLTAKQTYADAVSIYTQRLMRPRSASAGTMSKGKSPVSRPFSAVINRQTTSTFTPLEPTVDTYNEQAIQDALQRLALRQQARQYSAVNSSCVLSQENLASRPPTGYHGYKPEKMIAVHHVADHANPKHVIRSKEPSFPSSAQIRYKPEENSSRPVTSVKRPQSYLVSKPPTSHGRQNNTTNTFNTFIEDSGQAKDIANAYKQITGNTHYDTGHHNSRQLQYAQQQMFKQQRLMEQSKALLEQSRAKHQTMVAQAHAAQRTLSGNENLETRKTQSERHSLKAPYKNRTVPHPNNAQTIEHSMPRSNSNDQILYRVNSSERLQQRNSKPSQTDQLTNDINQRQQLSRTRPQSNNKKLVSRSHKTSIDNLSDTGSQKGVVEVYKYDHGNDVDSQSFAPKPPDQPPGPKRLPSTYRIARTTNDDEKHLNIDFYNSLKYDIHTGQTRSRGGDTW